MGPDRLRVNVADSLFRMKRDAGKIPGGETGLCQPWVLNVLGYRTVFRPPKSDRENIALEMGAGFVPYPVCTYKNPITPEIVIPLLTQRKVSFDAIHRYGKVRGKEAYHDIAVIPEDGMPPYHIANSLVPGRAIPSGTQQEDPLLQGGIQTVETPQDVSVYIERLFDTEGLRFFVVPDAKEYKRILESHKRYEDIAIGGGDIIIATFPIHEYEVSQNIKISTALLDNE